MRAAWAALSLLLLPGLGQRALPHMATGAGTTPGTTPGTALGTALGTTPGTALGTTPGTALGTTPGTTPGTAPGTTPGTSGTALGTPGDTCGTTGGDTRGDTGGGDTGGDTGGDSGYEPGSVSAAFVTCPNLGVATELARALVLQGLAACVNVVPGVTSVYTWQGKLEEDSEVLLMIKTRSSRVPALTEFVRRQHPYEVPEVVALPVAQGNAPYLRWVRDVVPP